MNRQVYGYVNGKAVYSGEDFVFEKRGFGPISDDTALIAYAEKVTHGWHSAGWKRTFTTFFLDTYKSAGSSRRRSSPDFRSFSGKRELRSGLLMRPGAGRRSAPTHTQTTASRRCGRTRTATARR